MNMEILYIVVPCYNEEAVLPETSKRLSKKVQALISQNKISEKSKIVFVDDGSKDSTWNIIVELHKQDSMFRGIKLSRNKGHQNALLSGLMTSKESADMVISIDADLQDDVNVIDGFVDKYLEGYDIVYGVRSSRKTDSFFKRLSAQGFYKLMSLLGVDTVYNHADCRLMSKRALDGLESFHEVNLFLRGIVPLIGYKSTEVYYERDKRFAGESKYPLKKMLGFAAEGITSFSIKPIRFITWLGFVMFFISIIFLIDTLIGTMAGRTITGWSSMIMSIWGIGGLQLLATGIVGEYIGKVYLETKGRPKYFIEQYLEDGE